MKRLITPLAALLAAFTLLEVNYPFLTPQGQLAGFAGVGMVLCFLQIPMRRGKAPLSWEKWLNPCLSIIAFLVFTYIFVQSEPMSERFWSGGVSLGNRAGAESRLDMVVAVLGLILVLEAARRSVGWALPILAALFLLYAFVGPYLPSWLFAHRGYSLDRVTSQAFLHSQGVFGIALRVMFTYVYLFVLFGALLEATGTTSVIIGWTRRLFHGSRGGAAKVAVLSSGLMGSLSGSAVANTATTGTFTIPLMRSSGFKSETAAAIEAAASSGGALVPPVMGAGAYMMLEIIDPPVTFVQIIRAAIIPAALYYFAILMTVHFWSGKIKAAEEDASDELSAPNLGWHMSLFAGSLGALIVLLLVGFSPFRAVSVSMLVLFTAAALRRDTRISLARLIASLRSSAVNSIPLITAAACVGIVIGVVTLTGLGSKLPQLLIPLGQDSLLLALILIMVTSLVLGMGLPSAVCYLLLATFIGTVIKTLGIPPLAGHLFIFYFGLMSMVTPPVALAAYAASSIAGSNIMKTSLLAFRFSLVGFVLPFLFIYQPELLMINAAGQLADPLAIVFATGWIGFGVYALSAALAGFWNAPLTGFDRIFLALAAWSFFAPIGPLVSAALAMHLLDLVGLALLMGFWLFKRQTPVPNSAGLANP